MASTVRSFSSTKSKSSLEHGTHPNKTRSFLSKCVKEVGLNCKPPRFHIHLSKCYRVTPSSLYPAGLKVEFLCLNPSPLLLDSGRGTFGLSTGHRTSAQFRTLPRPRGTPHTAHCTTHALKLAPRPALRVPRPALRAAKTLLAQVHHALSSATQLPYDDVATVLQGTVGHQKVHIHVLSGLDAGYGVAKRLVREGSGRVWWSRL